MNVIVGGYQMPAGSSTKGIEGEWVNNYCYSSLSQQGRSLPLRSAQGQTHADTLAVEPGADKHTTSITYRQKCMTNV